MTKTAYGSHTQWTERGTGDYYGSGKKNKMCKIRHWSSGDAVPSPVKEKLKIKPKALA